VPSRRLAILLKGPGRQFDTALVPHDGEFGPDEFQGLLSAAAGGDRPALAAIWSAYQPRLRGYVASLDRGNAEDVCSETWISVGRGLARFQGGESEFRSWLFTIAHRRLVDQQRRDRRRTAESLDATGPGGPDPAALADPSVGPEAAALAGDATREAVRLIADLPGDQARAVLLRVVGGLTPTEVGAVLGKKPGAVRVLTHRGLRSLAVALGAGQAFRLVDSESEAPAAQPVPAKSVSRREISRQRVTVGEQAAIAAL